MKFSLLFFFQAEESSTTPGRVCDTFFMHRFIYSHAQQRQQQSHNKTKHCALFAREKEIKSSFRML